CLFPQGREVASEAGATSLSTGSESVTHVDPGLCAWIVPFIQPVEETAGPPVPAPTGSGQDGPVHRNTLPGGVQTSGTDGRTQISGAVGPFPGEIGQLTPEVTVSSRLGVDRTQQVQVSYKRGRTQIEDLHDGLLDHLRGHLLGSEGLDEHTDRVRLSDGVGDLDLDAIGELGRDDVLGHPARGVGGRTVHLRRVLAGEGTTTMTGVTTVGVDDDLAAGQTGVTHGATDLEATGRVHQ